MVNKKKCLLKRIEECKIKKVEILKDNNHMQEIALEIDVNMIAYLLSIIGNELPEITVWSRYLDWEMFISMISGMIKFSKYSKVPIKEEGSFYLDFNPYEGNKVEIICDASFNDSGNIKREDLLKIVSGFN